MVPRISVRRQIRYRSLVAIERLRGIQYRCLRCNTVFFDLDDLDAHVRREGPGPESNDVPEFDQPLLLRIYYSEDIREGWGETLKERKRRRSALKR
jgi:Zn-finger nucleic acid-binding protein